MNKEVAESLSKVEAQLGKVARNQLDKEVRDAFDLFDAKMTDALAKIHGSNMDPSVCFFILLWLTNPPGSNLTQLTPSEEAGVEEGCRKLFDQWVANRAEMMATDFVEIAASALEELSDPRKE